MTAAVLLLQGLAVYLPLINITAAVMTAVDKRRAQRGVWRIPESRLLLVALLGGALGEWLTMLFIRHKTKHLKFMLMLPLFLAVHTVLLGWLLICLFS